MSANQYYLEPEVPYVERVTHFLLEKTGSTLSTYKSRMTAKEQRLLFGKYIGKGTIVIDGANEVVFNRVKVCFGLDYDDRNVTKWGDL